LNVSVLALRKCFRHIVYCFFFVNHCHVRSLPHWYPMSIAILVKIVSAWKQTENKCSMCYYLVTWHSQFRCVVRISMSQQDLSLSLISYQLVNTCNSSNPKDLHALGWQSRRLRLQTRPRAITSVCCRMSPSLSCGLPTRLKPARRDFRPFWWQVSTNADTGKTTNGDMIPAMIAAMNERQTVSTQAINNIRY
jgi:hypothetical protein